MNKKVRRKTYVFEMLKPGIMPVWSGQFKDETEALDYLFRVFYNANERGFEAAILFTQDEEYRLYFYKAFFMNKEMGKFEES